MCSSDLRLDALERRHETLLENIKKMEDRFDAKLDLILSQLNKVAILEEKHTYQSASLERAFTRIKDLDDQVDALSSFKDQVKGMARMAYLIWGAMGVSIAAIVAKVYG